MKRSDIGVIIMIYATCLLFGYMTLQLKPAAQIYPMCLIIGLAILNTIFLLLRLFQAFKDRLPGKSFFYNDLPEIFSGFQARQFFFVVCACIAYLALLRYFGFYLSSLIYLAGVMAWLRVKNLQMLLTVVVLGLLIFAVFTEFLSVPLPKGLVFS